MGKRSQMVYPQFLRWESLTVENSEGRAWIKTLNIDPETGARSALIKYERGFKRAAAESEWASDILVLEGEMECGDVTYNTGTYHYRPAGTACGPVHTSTGITRLVLSVADDKGKTPVFVQDINSLPFQRSYTNPEVETAVVKMLRQDAEAGVTVLISGAFKPDIVKDGTVDVHEHFEECYCLEGELEDYLEFIDGHLMWMPGFYIYREPFTSGHGEALRHKTPCLVLVRRGWVGETLQFHEQGWKEHHTRPVAAIEYEE